MPCSCSQPKVQTVYYDPRSFQMPWPMPGQGGMMMPTPMQGQGSMMMPTPMPGQGGGMMPMPMPGQGGSMMPTPMPGQGGSMMPTPMPGQGGGTMPWPMPGQGGSMMPTPMPGQGGSMMPMPMPGQGGSMMPTPMPGQGGSMMPAPMPGQGGMDPLPFPAPGTGGVSPFAVPGQGAVPAQLSQANLPNVLAQYPRPVGQPPADMLFLFNTLRRNPQMLQSFITQRPQTLQQGVQFAQTGAMGPRDAEDDVRLLPGFCFNRWSLIFTRNNVLLMFPVANLFGFVIGWCHPLTPCLVPNFQILFAFC
ncbi:hypothetical protein H8B09_27390 [Paenibacillus sp. PR3]|uniref:Uncharacterized protein n=1 Tax=Paenibacillus terricola TaxID=2763503 RepID=A0ABR8N2W0_9BACL|nr:hypothetical protein [Paenibacillus terricola]MBD3922508.1 hypothetical protein [Paenibacillus terricola]